MSITPGNGSQLVYRTSTGGSASADTPFDGVSAPYWMRLVRSGNTLTGYKSSNGSNWTSIGSHTISMTTDVYVGLAVCAHNNSTLCTSVLDSVQAPGGGPPQPPGQATSPSPSNGASDVSVNANLSWTAGSGATSHDVYFGTDSTPDSGEFQGNQSGTTYDPGTMSESTTYYWRIDEVNAGGTTTGVVWSFTTGTGGGPGVLNVMSLGDSITEISPGYRGPLWDMLETNGYTIDYVGTMYDSGVADPDHEGHGGFTIGPGPSLMDDYTGGMGNIYVNLQDYMATDPDIILMLIGINDYFNIGDRDPDYDPDTDGPVRLAGLIDEILTIKPSCTILVSNITAVDWDANFANAFNAEVPGICSERQSQGKDVYFVDMRGECNWVTGDWDDGLHPSASGYQKMTNVWYNHLVPHLQ